MPALEIVIAAVLVVLYLTLTAYNLAQLPPRPDLREVLRAERSNR